MDDDNDLKEMMAKEYRAPMNWLRHGIEAVLKLIQDKAADENMEAAWAWEPFLVMLITLVTGIQSFVNRTDDFTWRIYERLVATDRVLKALRADLADRDQEVRDLRQRLRVLEPPPPPKLSVTLDDLSHEAKFLALLAGPDRKGIKIEAIKKVRQVHGLGLADAKNLIEAFLACPGAGWYRDQALEWALQNTALLPLHVVTPGKMAPLDLLAETWARRMLQEERKLLEINCIK